MELGSCHPSVSYNFDLAPEFLENLCTALTLLRISKIAICCRDNQESLRSEKTREVRRSLYDNQVHKDDSAPVSEYIVRVQAAVH